MATLHTHKHRASRRRRREKSREGKSGHPLMRDYEDDVAKCRESAQSNAVAALATAHTDLLTKVGAVKTTNTTLLSTLQTQFSALLLPLNDTEIATTGNATRGVSEQIESFRAQLAAGERELKRLWGLWDEAQGEIEKLGREGGGGVMKGWEEEVRDRIGGMEREVEEAGREAVRGMGEAEKEIDKKLRDEQAKLVAMMFREE
ncbi:hypothetical protein VE01_06379 [Pseudogymnoascus verrucosus]|uniref:Uncharacterized protein n=1 Tax=Pseudogymnoascus verrucosus TaxID=342668 RepID=A0A1B8GG87_9PEZI|nr:uncharacterized protein VE01_06379 [Pseudogymnoascus verrucosus]OBT94836.1 hypothetical protein VE01_06379 [Pseudogymnoascus verrucosus]